jgi:hypothetical protein
MVPSKYSKYATSFRYSYKVKFKLEQPMKAQSGSRGIALYFSNLGAKLLRGQRHVPAALLVGNRPDTHLYRRLGGPQDCLLLQTRLHNRTLCMNE